MSSKDEFNYIALMKSILTEHNRIREDPKSYIPILQDHMNYFKGDLILYRPNETPIETFEGVAAYHEAIEFLTKQKPVEALNFEESLAKAAMDHVNDIGPKGLLSHDSSDGKNVSDRIEMHVEWDTACCESLECGSKTGQDVIISLVVDDGLLSRGQRFNLFRPDLHYIGIACGPHRDQEVISVLNYVGGIRDKGKAYFDFDNYKYDYPKNVAESSLKKEADAAFVENKVPGETSAGDFQEEDKDAPLGTISMRIVKTSRMYNGRKVKVTKKFYKKRDGTEHIVELEEI